METFKVGDWIIRNGSALPCVIVQIDKNIFNENYYRLMYKASGGSWRVGFTTDTLGNPKRYYPSDEEILEVLLLRLETV